MSSDTGNGWKGDGRVQERGKELRARRCEEPEITYKWKRRREREKSAQEARAGVS